MRRFVEYREEKVRFFYVTTKVALREFGLFKISKPQRASVRERVSEIYENFQSVTMS